MIQQINSLAKSHIPFLLIVDFEMQHPLIYPLNELPNDIRFTTPAYRSPEDTLVSLPVPVEFKSEPLEFSRYEEAFRIVIENARAGKTYLTNLTFPSSLTTNLSLQHIYQFSQAKYKLLFRK